MAKRSKAKKQPISVPVGAKIIHDKIVAKGETTGHTHRIVTQSAVVYEEQDGTVCVAAPDGLKMLHEEHGPMVRPADHYVRTIAQEYDHPSEEAREVRD